jgi:ribosomal protein L17
MRHGNKLARLGRPADQRKALIRGLVTEVLRHGKIQTTKVWSIQAVGTRMPARSAGR